MNVKLSNSLAKQLEQDSTCFANCVNETINIKLYMDVIGWIHSWPELSINQSLPKKAAELSKRLGFKQNYCVTYNERNYVWAFTWEEIPILIYLSTAGTGIQIMADTEDPLKVLTHLNSLLVKPGNSFSEQYE